MSGQNRNVKRNLERPLKRAITPPFPSPARRIRPATAEHGLDTGTAEVNRLIQKVRNALARQDGHTVIGEQGPDAKIWRVM
jgi:hypothetical protein